MRLPRFSIGWLMFGIAILCVPFALLQNALNRHSLTATLTIGLWPTLTTYGTASFVIAKHRGKRSPFLWGFAVAGWISVLVYGAGCFFFPEVLIIPVGYYLRADYWWIVWLTDSDRYEMYLLNLLVMGLILATPQLMIAIVGGLIARDIWWGTRWNST
jgi:hypothetical protein